MTKEKKTSEGRASVADFLLHNALNLKILVSDSGTKRSCTNPNILREFSYGTNGPSRQGRIAIIRIEANEESRDMV